MNDYTHGYYAVLGPFFDVWDAPYPTRASAQERLDSYSELEEELRVVYIQNDPPDNLPINKEKNHESNRHTT